MAKKDAGWVRAKEVIVIVVGARPVQYERRIVRDRHTGLLHEIDIHELPPVDPGDEGIPYVFKTNQRARADHPAVLQSPHAFVSEEEAKEMALGEVG